MTDGQAARDAAEEFERHRPRLLGIAYRLLGSMWDAEDVVADALVRWLRPWLPEPAITGPSPPSATLDPLDKLSCVDRQLSQPDQPGGASAGAR